MTYQAVKTAVIITPELTQMKAVLPALLPQCWAHLAAPADVLCSEQPSKPGGYLHLPPVSHETVYKTSAGQHHIFAS